MPVTYILDQWCNLRRFELIRFLNFPETQPDLVKFRNLFSHNFEIKKISHIRSIIKINPIITSIVAFRPLPREWVFVMISSLKTNNSARSRTQTIREKILPQEYNRNSQDTHHWHKQARFEGNKKCFNSCIFFSYLWKGYSQSFWYRIRWKCTGSELLWIGMWWILDSSLFDSRSCRDSRGRFREHWSQQVTSPRQNRPAGCGQTCEYVNAVSWYWK